MRANAVESWQLHKSYRTGRSVTDVLRGVDLQVGAGECVFLVGPSGSGKTTLLSILGGVLTPDTGRLRLFGTDLASLSAAERTRFRLRRIGLVFQRFHLFERLTAAENIRAVCNLLGLSARPARRRADELLSRVGLSDRTEHRVMDLSMGQRQRVAIARALVADPDLILADEPTASLDSESGLRAMQLLKELCRLGKTVIVVTHDDRIRPLADRILMMHDGRIGTEHQRPERTRFRPDADLQCVASLPLPQCVEV